MTSEDHRELPDSAVQNSGALCLHYPGHDRYDFRLEIWDWDERDHEPHDIPFRCLYSVNISNLLMAGKRISVQLLSSWVMVDSMVSFPILPIITSIRFRKTRSTLNRRMVVHFWQALGNFIILEHYLIERNLP